MRCNAYDLIKRPLTTEKSISFESLGKYNFVVRANSNKSQIKEAFEKIFKVKIKSVNIVNVCRKSKVFKGQKGFRSGFKKAIVTTADMNKIDYTKEI